MAVLMFEWPDEHMFPYPAAGNPNDIQYLAEADNFRVRVALDLKAAFQNVSHKAMLLILRKSMRTLELSFPSCAQAPNRMHYHFAYTKINANNGVDQGCPLSACGFQLSPLYFDQSWRKYTTIQALNSSLTTGIGGSNNSAYHGEVLPSLHHSTLLYILHPHNYRKVFSRTPFPLNFKTMSHTYSHMELLGGHPQIHKTLNEALLFWESRLQHNAFRNANTPTNLNTEGLIV